ncbi:hypothetical protein [Microbacterium sp. YJN-G]|nr:hypothetical protein [Microbacterium sp. YJN-G]
MSRAYVMKTTKPVPEEAREAARRMVARRVTDPAERMQLEDMLGLAS